MSLMKLWRMPQADPSLAVATAAVEAHVLREEGRLAEARALLEQEYARRPDAVVIANDLCVTMMFQDDAASAVRFFARSSNARINRRGFGPSSSTIWRTPCRWSAIPVRSRRPRA
jgi:hypothetical protein